MKAGGSSAGTSRLSTLFASSLNLHLLSLCGNVSEWAEAASEEPGSFSGQVFCTCAAIALSGEAQAGEDSGACEES